LIQPIPAAISWKYENSPHLGAISIAGDGRYFAQRKELASGADGII